MPIVLQALLMGIIQGLTEFLPISSSGHLIVAPYLFGWDDPFITSLAFSVMLHMGTLVALLVYFWRDWLVLVPAGFATIRDRSFRDDPNRRLAWLIVAATVPALIAAPILNDTLEAAVRSAGRRGDHDGDRRGGPLAGRPLGRQGPGRGTARASSRPLVIGVAQAFALFPGISRSGISISAGLLVGPDPRIGRPVQLPDGHPDHRGGRAVRGGQAGPGRCRRAASSSSPLVVGMLAALVAGLAAIHFMLRYLRTNTLTIFVVYRLVVAAVVIVVFLSR